jgi:cysteine-rich repeat protein
VVRQDLELDQVGFELCDDGNLENDDSCTARCAEARCGDGIHRRDLIEGEPGFEGCDDGNQEDGDGCLNRCTIARCGDGVVHEGQEECDDGNLLGDDGCTAECTRGFGDGRDGELALDSSVAIPSVRSLCQGAAGDRNLSFDGNAVFEAGMILLIHQSQAAEGEVGHFEYAELAGREGPRLTLVEPLQHSYLNGDGARCQVTEVKQYTQVQIAAGGRLEAPAWNGQTGGILAIDVVGGLVVRENGTLSAEGAGFRGQGHGGRYRCARGYTGEGHRGGFGDVDVLARGSGGGGGGSGQDDASGGGGGHAQAGDEGDEGGCGACREACPSPGGSAGAATDDDLISSALFGGAGGEGGADEDGCHPGAGGHGGGLIFVRAMTLTVEGQIIADGDAGANGNSSCGGCGMGGGGGGAGGGIRIETLGPAILGEGQVTAEGASGGRATCGSRGGGGGDGRILINAAEIDGRTQPSYREP